MVAERMGGGPTCLTFTSPAPVQTASSLNFPAHLLHDRRSTTVHRQTLFLLLFAVLSVRTQTAIRADQPDAAAPPRIAAVEAAMQDMIDAHEIIGAVTLVGHQGELAHLSAVGLADTDAPRPMQIDTPFAIASMTKPITATLLMMLVEEGKVALEDPASKYIPSFADVRLASGATPSTPITVWNCLTHTSGLTGTQAVTATLAETANEIATRKLAFDPGQQWKYGPGLTVAARVIEVASQTDFETFLRQRLLLPLQMTRTTFRPTEDVQKRMAKIHTRASANDSGSDLVPAENHIVDYEIMIGPNPSGGLVSTAGDLFRFYEMIRRGGEYEGRRYLQTDTVTRMTTLQTGDLQTGFTPGNGWGLGWCIVKERQGVSKMLSPGSYGHGGAFGTQGWIDPESETVYVLMIQRTKMGNSDASAVRENFQSAAANHLAKIAE